MAGYGSDTLRSSRTQGRLTTDRGSVDSTRAGAGGFRAVGATSPIQATQAATPAPTPTGTAALSQFSAPSQNSDDYLRRQGQGGGGGSDIGGGLNGAMSALAGMNSYSNMDAVSRPAGEPATQRGFMDSVMDSAPGMAVSFGLSKMGAPGLLASIAGKAINSLVSSSKNTGKAATLASKPAYKATEVDAGPPDAGYIGLGDASNPADAGFNNGVYGPGDASTGGNDVGFNGVYGPGDVSTGGNDAVGGFSGSFGGDASGNAGDGGMGGGGYSGGYGGGGDGGGGKIVCTAMNQTYGFGSFRNAIWLSYAKKNLTPYHEKGYHALFLPLVKLGFHSGSSLTSRMLRATLEHIARHRSVDLRAEMRKAHRDPLGRIYRSLLEPLCYLVGRFILRKEKP